MSFQRFSESITCWYCRLSFPHIWEPAQVMVQGVPKGDFRYSAMLILPHSMVERIKALENRLIRLSWPHWAGLEPPADVTLRKALKRGDVIRPDDPHLRDKWVLRAYARSDSRPWVVSKDIKTGNYLPVTDQSRIYAGCEAHVNVALYTTQFNVHEPQINVGLNGLEITGRNLPSFESRITTEQALGAGPDIVAPPAPIQSTDIEAPGYPSNSPSSSFQKQEIPFEPEQNNAVENIDPENPLTW